MYTVPLSRIILGKMLWKLGILRRIWTPIKKCDSKLAILDENLREKSMKQKLYLQRVRTVFSDSQN